METFLNLSAVRGFFPSCQGTWRPPWACQTFGFHAILQYLTFSFCAPRRRGKCSQIMSYMCHIHNYTEYNQHWNVFSAFNPSKCTHTWSSGQPTLRRPGSSWGFSAQGSHLSRGQFLPEPRFEPTTSGYKSDALSIRATTALHVQSVLTKCKIDSKTRQWWNYGLFVKK